MQKLKCQKLKIFNYKTMFVCKTYFLVEKSINPRKNP